MARTTVSKKVSAQKAWGFLFVSLFSVVCFFALSAFDSYAFADVIEDASGATNIATTDVSKTKAGQGDQAGEVDSVADVIDATDKTDPSDQAPSQKPILKPTKSGWLKDSDGSWYYFANTSAQPSTGWIKLKGTWYYLDPTANGRMATGKFSDGTASYIASASGAMYANKWVKIGSDWYYATSSGALKSGWQKSGSKWYWLQADKDGLMATSAWVTDESKRYYLDASGAMKTGWLKLGDDWYYASASGAAKSGWQKSGSKWYWLDPADAGKMATDKWITDKSKRYYLDASGAMKTGWISIDKDWYYANKSGALVNGWQKSGSKWYYLQPDKQGLMIANELKTIDKKDYSFDGNGAMRANTTVDLGESKVGYAASSGAITQIGTKENGKLVLRDAKGNALTGWQKLAGVWFYGDEGGTAHTGWLTLGSKKYWMDSNGVMATGVRTIDGKKYVFSTSGAYLPVSAAHAAVYELALKELEKCTNDSMTKEQKLRAAYNYIRDNFREYNPRIPHMKQVGWENTYADDIFIRRGGNCLSCAAAMAFMAKAIGYENVYACNSGGHGWAEIDGRVYDPEWERHNSGSYYGLSYNAGGKQNYKGAISAGYAWMHVAI